MSSGLSFSRAVVATPSVAPPCRATRARQGARAFRTRASASEGPAPRAVRRVLLFGLSTFAGTALVVTPLWAPARRGRWLLTAMAAQKEEVLVKAAVGEPDKLGDCPFSQRVLLTLEEKGVPYDAKFIDTSNKPQWFLEINPEGKVPVLKHDGKWVPDSDAIAQLLEEKYPEPSLAAPPEKASVGGPLFPAFLKFLKSKDPTDGSEAGLVAELAELDKQLKEPGPYIAGEKVSAPDLALLPKLYHVETALGHYKHWSIPADLTALHKYLELMEGRDSFKKTAAPKEVVVRGWASKV